VITARATITTSTATSAIFFQGIFSSPDAE
jgi:hypothetical protein